MGCTISLAAKKTEEEEKNVHYKLLHANKIDANKKESQSETTTELVFDHIEQQTLERRSPSIESYTSNLSSQYDTKENTRASTNSEKSVPSQLESAVGEDFINIPEDITDLEEVSRNSTQGIRNDLQIPLDIGETSITQAHVAGNIADPSLIEKPLENGVKDRFYMTESSVIVSENTISEDVVSAFTAPNEADLQDTEDEEELQDREQTLTPNIPKSDVEDSALLCEISAMIKPTALEISRFSPVHIDEAPSTDQQGEIQDNTTHPSELGSRGYSGTDEIEREDICGDLTAIIGSNEIDPIQHNDSQHSDTIKESPPLLDEDSPIYTAAVATIESNTESSTTPTSGSNSPHNTLTPFVPIFDQSSLTDTSTPPVVVRRVSSAEVAPVAFVVVPRSSRSHRRVSRSKSSGIPTHRKPFIRQHSTEGTSIHGGVSDIKPFVPGFSVGGSCCCDSDEMKFLGDETSSGRKENDKQTPPFSLQRPVGTEREVRPFIPGFKSSS